MHHNQVWIGIALSVAAVIVSWYMIVKMKRVYLTEVRIPLKNISDIFMHCIGTLCNQGKFDSQWLYCYKESF